MSVLELDDSAVDYPIHNNVNENIRDDFFEEYTSSSKDIKLLLGKYVRRPRLIIRIWSCVPDKIRGSFKKIMGW